MTSSNKHKTQNAVVTKLTVTSQSKRQFRNKREKKIQSVVIKIVSRRTGNANASTPTIFPCLHPVNPHMRNEAARLQTFLDNLTVWPAHRINATPEEISRAGMYYLGNNTVTN